MRYALSVQGFWQQGAQYILKELAVVPIDKALDNEPRLYNYLIKPPYPWKRLTQKYRDKNTWLMHNYHGLKWESGNFSYDQIRNILEELLCDSTMVYVDGSDCKEWLSKYIKKSVMDIRELGYVERSRSVVTVCTNHRPLRKVICALHHAKLIRDWAHHHIDAMEWEDISDWTFLHHGRLALVENSDQTQAHSNKLFSGTISSIGDEDKKEKIRWMSLIFFKPCHLPIICRN